MAISQAKPLLLLLLVSLFLLPALGNKTRFFGNCDTQHQYPAIPTAVDISPYPVYRTHNANFTITGYTKIAIPSGVSVDLYLRGRYFRPTYSLCDITACPVSPGPFVLTFTNVFTSKYQKMKADVMVNLRIMEKNMKDPIMCMGFYCPFTGYVPHLSQVTE
ncbi:PREDICTED: uncharacterized protein LOC104777125 [Camelina sativa]|uniref:Uncharacterized protein LOC104777125 n=1 Tax=Camelina sativa TaxID=90675 RepID=A0ABM0YE93_CAMSA|nr:PREDICTED: uncharacterized protein LOC104777125 [Camelina sativa]